MLRNEQFQKKFFWLNNAFIGDSTMNKQKNFVSETGLLVSKFLVGLNGGAAVVDINVCFRDTSNDLWHYRSICRIFRGVSEWHRYFPGFTEASLYRVVEQIPDPHRIVLRTYCSSDILNMFVRLYPESKRNELAQWYTEVSSFPTLQGDEKGRIERILCEFGIL